MREDVELQLQKAIDNLNSRLQAATVNDDGKCVVCEKGPRLPAILLCERCATVVKMVEDVEVLLKAALYLLKTKGH